MTIAKPKSKRNRPRVSRTHRQRVRHRQTIIDYIAAHPGERLGDVSAGTGILITHCRRTLENLRMGLILKTQEDGAGGYRYYAMSYSHVPSLDAYLTRRLPEDLDAAVTHTTRTEAAKAPVRSPERPARRDWGIRSSFASVLDAA